MTNAAEDIVGDRSESTNRICQCFDFSYGDMQRMLVAKPQMEFDELLETTHVGSKCTACLLDLEYFFVELAGKAGPIGVASAANFSDVDSKKDVSETSLKQKFYDLVDWFAPMVHPPDSQNYYLPVIGGHGIEQFVWIANRSLLFEKKICAPSMTIELTVRDDQGQIVYDGAHRLEQEADLRVNVSRYLSASSNSRPAVGSVRIARKADEPGLRGTTRPQIEIVGREGAACVHGQAPSPTAGSWQTFLCRPQEERIFFAVANASNKTMNLIFSYPYALVDDCSPPPSGKLEVLPPYGAAIHEVILTSEELERFKNKPFSVNWVSASNHKAYILCSTPTLSEFSVDHV